MELSRDTCEPELGAARLPFNRAARAGGEQRNVDAAMDGGHLAANGPFTEECCQWLAERLGSPVLLVHSCTAALEMAAILAEVGPGDEVIMPSYTFVSTANAFVLRGATPVFVDVREDTLTIDVEAVAAALTPRTKAVVPVHYAGVSCRMDELLRLTDGSTLVIEDAAQGLLASLDGRPLGTMGALGALSFHETKNVTCGEGGALIVNDPALMARAEVLREKGTDRSRFTRGQVDKYTWVDLGSSHALSELGAAFLAAQLEASGRLTARRVELWDRYHAAFAGLEREGLARRPVIPDSCTHNGHMYHLRLEDEGRRDALIAHLGDRGIGAVFHYVPLHSSPAGERYAKVCGSLGVTEAIAPRLVRLPLWPEMEDDDSTRVIAAVLNFFGRED